MLLAGIKRMLLQERFFPIFNIFVITRKSISVPCDHFRMSGRWLSLVEPPLFHNVCNSERKLLTFLSRFNFICQKGISDLLKSWVFQHDNKYGLCNF